MRFADKLKKLMKDLEISQSKISQLTGYGKSSVSQWVSGKNEPSAEKKKEIALALGVPKDYFDEFEAGATLQNNPVFNLPVHVAARLMGKSIGFVQDGLRDQRFPWGYAVKMSTRWSYWINSKRFSKIEEIDLPLKEII